MISIAEAISDLLFLRDTVVVPGLGAFVKKPVPAMVNPVANYFAMPSCEIVFDANLREDNDLIVGYLAEKNDIPLEEAKKLLAMFVSDCFNTLKQSKKVVLNQLGTLYYDGGSDLAFDQDKSVNYNSDTFGLCDFTPQPIVRSKSKEEIKAEIERQQKDKNTPMTVDEKSVHSHDDEDDYDDDDDEGGGGWLWIVLGLLLVAGIIYGLHYYKVIDIERWLHRPAKRVVNVESGTYKLPTYHVDWDEVLEQYKEKTASKAVETVDSVEVVEPVDTVEVVEPAETIETIETIDTVETVKPVETVDTVQITTGGNIRIIAGCFAQEENAERLTNTLKDKGYQNAFYELRGSKWYVSFGRYATDEEAATAVREIRANTEYKAWILK